MPRSRPFCTLPVTPTRELGDDLDPAGLLEPGQPLLAPGAYGLAHRVLVDWPGATT